jgi:hypothetical protein
MYRFAVFVAFLLFLLPVEAQLFSQGPPASAISPTPDGRTHGAPASVVSPNPPPFVPGRGPFSISNRPFRPFGTLHRRLVFVPVPLFYPIYGAGYDSAYPSIADPSVQSADPAPAQATDSDNSGEDALRAAYIQGVRDAMAQQQTDSRYGQHSGDLAESARLKPQPAPPSEGKADPKPPADDSPATVFIFKDGHQIETHNFAIMGQTLYDLSSTPLRKVQLSDLDAVATVKANDDRGIIVKLQ